MLLAVFIFTGVAGEAAVVAVDVLLPLEHAANAPAMSAAVKKLLMIRCMRASF